MNVTLTSTLRVYHDADGTAALVETTDRNEIARILGAAGVTFERWDAGVSLAGDAAQESILAAYADDIRRLREAGGYTSVDVLRVGPSTPDLPPLRQKFLREHTHSEDEVRFFVEGGAAFYLRIGGKVYQTICTRGDLISVPAGTTHWFDMGPAPSFATIRMFVDPAGWVARYTGDEIATRFPKYE